MSVVSSAAGQNHRVGGRRQVRCRAGDMAGLMQEIEIGWRHFWRARHVSPPEVVKCQVLNPVAETDRWWQAGRSNKGVMG